MKNVNHGTGKEIRSNTTTRKGLDESDRDRDRDPRSFPDTATATATNTYNTAFPHSKKSDQDLDLV